MTDFAISVFRLFNAKGYSVPQMNIGYTEKNTGLEWRITYGGTRAYLVRFGDKLEDNLDEQAADSHFMIRRVTSSLLLSGLGLFQAETMGRLIFKKSLAWSHGYLIWMTLTLSGKMIHLRRLRKFMIGVVLYARIIF